MLPQRILVVDDEPDVAEIVAVVLRRADFEVHMVHSGRAALERLAAEPPYGLIVCDLVMPEVNGVAIYRAVLQRPEPRPRVLFLSGYHDAGGYEDFLRETGVPTLGKPFDVNGLRETVARLLSGT